jgi:tetratricopeptide (TPR) repeat protein
VATREHPALEHLVEPVVPTAVLIALRYFGLPSDDSVVLRRAWEAERPIAIRQRTERLAGNPNATLVLATHARHAVHADDPDLVIEAIRRVTFPDVTRQLTQTIADGGAPAAVELYHRLRRGYPAERFNEDLLNQLGYQLLREKNTGAAVALFELNAREYPDAANTHDSLGDGYEAAGRLQEALASYRRAVQIAQASSDPRLATYRANVERLEKRLPEQR